MCSCNHEAQGLFRFAIELAGIAPLQQLAIKRDHSQRFQKVMAGRICELTQIVVRLAERLIGLPKFPRALRNALLQPVIQFTDVLVDPLASGDVAYDRCDKQTFLRAAAGSG